MSEFAELLAFKDVGIGTLLLAFVGYIIFKMLKDDLVSGKRLEKEEAKNERLLTAVENMHEAHRELAGQVKDLSASTVANSVEQSRMTNAVLDGLREQAQK